MNIQYISRHYVLLLIVKTWVVKFPSQQIINRQFSLVNTHLKHIRLFLTFFFVLSTKNFP